MAERCGTLPSWQPRYPELVDPTMQTGLLYGLQNSTCPTVISSYRAHVQFKTLGRYAVPLMALTSWHTCTLLHALARSLDQLAFCFAAYITGLSPVA